MAKFDFKGMAKSAVANGKPIFLTTAGIIASQKFLDAKTFFPNVDPNKWFIKHEGAIKVGGVLVTLALWKKCPEMVKWLLIGIAIQGAIKETRVLTMSKEGKAFVDQIGAGEYDEQINSMAEEIKKMAEADISGITNNDYSSVAGNDVNPSVLLMENSQTGVSGMGNDDDFLFKRLAA